MPTDLLHDELSAIQVYQQSFGSVVHIAKYVREWNSERGEEQLVLRGYASGIVWKEDRIVTNHHVISGSSAIGVTFADGRSSQAEVVGSWPDPDIALLATHTPRDNFRPIPIGVSADLLVGQRVYVIGSPFGLRNSLSIGNISGLGREVRSAVTGHSVRGFIQTDAAMNPGCSGGALIDTSGKLIGINTCIVSTSSGTSCGVGFAIPVDAICGIVDQMERSVEVSRPNIRIESPPNQSVQWLGDTINSANCKVVENVKLEVQPSRVCPTLLRAIRYEINEESSIVVPLERFGEVTRPNGDVFKLHGHCAVCGMMTVVVQRGDRVETFRLDHIPSSKVPRIMDPSDARVLSQKDENLPSSMKKRKVASSEEDCVDEAMKGPPIEEQVKDAETDEVNYVSVTDITGGSKPAESKKIVSCKDSLPGINGSHNEDADDEFMLDDQDEEEGIRDDHPGNSDEDPLCPVVEVTAEERKEFCKPWKSSVIIKVLGKRLGYRFLRAKLEKLWSLVGTFDLIDVENDYYIARFSDMEDCESVLANGPWMIANQYLLVQRWRPDFDPYKDGFHKVAVWARVLGLRMEYYNKTFLCRLGNRVGRTLSVDPHTLREKDNMTVTDRGKFARICVEVDLRKTLVPTVLVAGTTHVVQYEGLRLICFRCGLFGHRMQSCPHHIKDDENNEQPLAVGPNVQLARKRRLEGDTSSSFGGSMVVQHSVKRQPCQNKKQWQIKSNHGDEETQIATRK